MGVQSTGVQSTEVQSTGVRTTGGRGSWLPVIEGKAALLASLVDIVALPLAVEGRDVDALVADIAAFEPSFGAILL